MKSLQVTNSPHISSGEKEFYSELGVMSSAAGYYVGTYFEDPAEGYKEPGSRDSGYFRTKDEAKEQLRAFEAGDLSKYRTNSF